MTTLSRELRRQLERTVREARTVAEAGAKKSLTQLGVGEAKAPSGLSAEETQQRNALRAHGRQLGDVRDSATGKQRTAHLRVEVAYQHWHRMLFARFLAENALLIEPESQVPITLEECRELARDKGEDWLALASRYAQTMLPQIFRSGDPALNLALPPETRSKLEDLMKALPGEVFTAEDSLGWVYQYWQADKKDAINRSESKIGADELPAVTQLFTEDYMVWFLLHNTLGAWWAGKVLAANPALAETAKNEDELRAACKIGDVEWTYLRFVREEGQPWRPATGTFEGWPKAAKDIKVLDPCMGSGHFLVFALPLLAAMRAQEEHLAPEAAIEVVLRDNLFGLEIDPRCTQIAAFNLALAAWRVVGFRPLPPLHLACSGLSLGVSKTEWLKLAERAAQALPVPPESDLLGSKPNLFSEAMQRGFEALYDLFTRAPWLGSLIDPAAAGGDLLTRGFKDLEPLLAEVMKEADTSELSEMAVAAQGLTKAAEMLAGKFTLVATNVPYLGRGKQDEVLREYCVASYPRSKADLATCFVERCLAFAGEGGSSAVVTPQNWLFLVTYKHLRKHLLREFEWDAVARLGEHGFESSQAAGAFTALLVLASRKAGKEQLFAGIDVASEPDPSSKSSALQTMPIAVMEQADQFNIPDCRITMSRASSGPLLADCATAWQGIGTSDNSQFLQTFWEFGALTECFRYVQTAPSTSTLISGAHHVLNWEGGSGRYYRHAMALKAEGRLGGWKSGGEAWGKTGLAVSVTRTPYVALYLQDMFDTTVAVIAPNEVSDAAAIYSFLSSDDYAPALREVDQALSVTEHTFLKVPFNLEHWRKVAAKKFPSGLPTPLTSDATQWLFNGHPKGADTPLHVAVARLLGYRWPRQTGSNFPDYPVLGPDGLGKFEDDDGIVALDPVQGEQPAAPRLVALLADAFGKDWSAARLAALLADADCAGKTLDDWLRDKFFDQHCALFHQRPFVWHVWDGRRDGFHALVNYHKLAAPNGEGKRTLEKLIYSYLGDWMDRQRADQRAGVEGADGRLAAAEHLKGELEKILAGEPPYDLFVRWKPLAEQPIGWAPDINDGVRMNIRPFMTARPYGARAGNSCILRKTPNIKWTKDRGKEPERDKAEYPWFWSWDEATPDFAGGKTFDGNRWNDLHYSVAAKQAARKKAQS